MLPLTGLLFAAVVFENVHVVPMDREHVLENRNVVVRDGRIAEIGRGRGPADAVRVDGKGKYLMPGFHEMHGHLPGENSPPELTARVLFLYLANGVTTVRGMQGAPSQIELRKQIGEGKLVGPNLYLAGPQLSGQSAPTPEAASKMVREQKAAGFHLLKIQEGLQPKVYDEIVKAARQEKIAFGGHVPNDVGLERCLAAGQSSIDHLDGYAEAIGTDESRIPRLVEAAVKSGAYHIPTMALWDVFLGAETVENLRRREDLRYMPRQIVDQWAASVTQRHATLQPNAAQVAALRRKVLKALSDAKAKIAFGTDSPQLFSVPGFSIHREMKVMSESGMSNFAILSSGTRAAAQYLARYAGGPKDSGVIARGSPADLILLDSNPLADTANLARRAGVMVRGQWIPESEIQKRLASYRE